MVYEIPVVSAASVAALVGMIWLLAKPSENSYSTGVGGFQHIVLDDQSAIDLNTDSAIRVAYSVGIRKVELLRGEASFAVAHNAQRPFVVLAGDTAVRAVGTRFDVQRLMNSVEITVDEGKVAVGEMRVLEATQALLPPNIPQIAAGQSATASGQGFKLNTLPRQDLDRKLAWQNQMLVFDGDTLSEVVAQFNRYNVRQLVIGDPQVATLRIGGYFKPTNIDAFVSALRSNFGIEAQDSGTLVLLKPASPSPAP